MAAITYGRRLVLILAAAVAVIVPVFALGMAAAWLADATCTPDEGYWGDLNCVGRAGTGFLLGTLAGLAVGVFLSVRLVRAMRR